MFETMLLKHLKSTLDIIDMLTSYRGEAAVFNQKAPNDKSDGWDKPHQCPYIVFYLTRQTDPERGECGFLNIDIFCSDNTVPPEKLEPAVRNAVDGYFFSDENKTTSTQWLRSNFFTEPEEKRCGVTVTFEMIDYPVQSAPNKFIDTVNEWTKKSFENVVLIGYDRISEVWKPTNLSPAVYWRIGETGPCGWIPSTGVGNWYTSVIHGHVIAPDISVMNNWAQAIIQQMDMQRALRLRDQTVMRIDHNNTADVRRDEYRVGQLMCECDYCIMRPRPTAPTLDRIFIDDKERRFNNGN